jgi:hypothetical protein
MTWTRPFDLSNSTRSKQPRVSLNDDTIGVCWQNSPGFVFRRSHDLGALWQSVEMIDSMGWEGDIDFDRGKIHAVYMGRHNGGAALFYRRWEPEGQGVEDDALPAAFSLSQPYPNPFNAQTAIEYALPEQTAVSLDVFDIQGRRVARLKDGILPAGYHKAVWDAKDAPSGIYFVRLRAGGFVETRKMVLLK